MEWRQACVWTDGHQPPEGSTGRSSKGELGWEGAGQGSGRKWRRAKDGDRGLTWARYKGSVGVNASLIQNLMGWKKAARAKDGQTTTARQRQPDKDGERIAGGNRSNNQRRQVKKYYHKHKHGGSAPTAEEESAVAQKGRRVEPNFAYCSLFSWLFEFSSAIIMI